MEKYFHGKRMYFGDADYVIEEIRLRRDPNPYVRHYPWLFNIWDVKMDRIVYSCHECEQYAWWFWTHDIPRDRVTYLFRDDEK